MTRINVVPPSELHNLHLITEYRELPRIFMAVREAIKRGERPDDLRNPMAYTLGPGHMRFFYPRLGWLRDRQHALIWELTTRGYNPEYSLPIQGIGVEWFGKWQVTEQALEINRQRIKERSINL